MSVLVVPKTHSPKECRLPTRRPAGRPTFGKRQTQVFGARPPGCPGYAAWLSLLLVVAPASARVAVLETRTGQVFEGLVRLESNAVVLANVERNLLLRIPATNLLRLTFRPRANPGSEPGLASWPRSGELPAPWQSDDLGRGAGAGSAMAFGDFFIVRSTGTNIAGRRDAFRFVSKPVVGRSDLLTRVLFVQSTHPLAQAGLMMRESLSAEAPNVFVGLTPQPAGVVQWRSAAGDETSLASVPLSRAAHWLRLKRAGQTFLAYSSTNGRLWSLLHTASVRMAEAMHVGLAVASGPGERLHTSTFERVQEAPWLWTGPMTPRVELQSGSVVVGLIRAMDEMAVHFWGAPPRQPVPTRAVSRIVCQWLSPRMAAALRHGKSGVLLGNGEFVEGACRRVEDGVLEVSSVLLGLRRFDLEGEVAVVALRPPALQTAPLAARMLDGSDWLGTVTGLGDGEVLLQEASLGLCRLPVHELAEVRWPR